jgi:hypothetical protein
MPPIESAVRRALADGHPDEAAAILRAAPDPPPIRTPYGIAQIDALRRRVAALERRQAPRRRGAALSQPKGPR